MKKFSDIQRDMLKMALAQRVSRSCGFNQLCIQNNGDNFECHVDGEFFAILGALAQLLKDLSNKSEIPCHIVCDYLGLLMEIVNEIEKGKQGECQQQNNADFSEFMSILTGENKEDK